MDGCKLIESRLDDPCGCIEEEWGTPAGYMSVHLTPQIRNRKLDWLKA